MDFTTGFIGTNKQGLAYEVVDGKISKKTRVKFLLDGAEVLTTKAYLREGLPAHPTFGKLLPGQVYTNKQGLKFELISKEGVSSWLIRFEDGVECTRESSSIRNGIAKHPTIGIPRVGEKYKARSGTFEVIEFNNATDVTVMFEDGSITKTSSSDIRKGVVGHPTSGLYVGYKFKTNSGWEGEVVKYNSCYDVLVKWQDGSFESHPASHIKNGGIKPLYQPSVADVGYFGEGRFSNYHKSIGEKAPQEIYNYWVRMITRCFNPEEIMKNAGRRYAFVEVNKEWFCFQSFAEWALTQPNWMLGFDLDKDLLGSGSEYSKDNCTFLPSDINVFLAENWSKSTHDLPIGVQYIRPATAGAKEGYVARCHTDKGRKYLGYFDDPMEAHFAYKNCKETYALVLAEKFKSVLTRDAYLKLKEFRITKVYPEPTPSCSKS